MCPAADGVVQSEGSHCSTLQLHQTFEYCNAVLPVWVMHRLQLQGYYVLFAGFCCCCLFLFFHHRKCCIVIFVTAWMCIFLVWGGCLKGKTNSTYFLHAAEFSVAWMWIRAWKSLWVFGSSILVLIVRS